MSPWSGGKSNSESRRGRGGGGGGAGGKSDAVLVKNVAGLNIGLGQLGNSVNPTINGIFSDG